MSVKDINPDNVIENVNDDLFPEHVPLIPLDLAREKQKEEIRKLAADLRKKGTKADKRKYSRHTGCHPNKIW